jgi:hypothetical protein
VQAKGKDKEGGFIFRAEGRVKGFIDLSDRVVIGYKGFGEVGLLIFKDTEE